MSFPVRSLGAGKRRVSLSPARTPGQAYIQVTMRKLLIMLRCTLSQMLCSNTDHGAAPLVWCKEGHRDGFRPAPQTKTPPGYPLPGRDARAVRRHPSISRRPGPHTGAADQSRPGPVALRTYPDHRRSWRHLECAYMLLADEPLQRRGLEKKVGRVSGACRLATARAMAVIEALCLAGDFVLHGTA